MFFELQSHKLTFLFCLVFALYSNSVFSLESQQGYFNTLQNVHTVRTLVRDLQKYPNTIAKRLETVAGLSNFRNVIKSRNLPEKNAFEFDFLESNQTTLPEVVTTITTSLVKTTTDELNVTTTSSLHTTNHESSTITPHSTVPPVLPFDVSQLCIDHLEGIIQGILNKELWALSMIDSDGKPASDILGGGLIWPGDYEECISVDAQTTVNQTSYHIEGKYCMGLVPLSFMKQTAVVQAPTLGVGLCLPKVCSDIDVSNLINSFLYEASNNTLLAGARCQHPDKPYDTRAIIILAIVGVFIVVMVTGTAYDILAIQMPKWQKESRQSELEEDLIEVESEKKPLITSNKHSHIQDTGSKKQGLLGKLLLCFSVYSNGEKILNTSQGSGTLTSINGIRFLSMTWVILGHTYAFVLTVVDNLFSFLPKMEKRLSFLAISNATVSVDTFFTLSGILLVYLVMKELKKNDGKINWGMFYFHRFWRLTPPYMLVLGTYVALFPYTGSGPAWNDDGVESNYCQDGFFYNLLYINNFVDDPKKQCFGWAWYLANDMQFFVISPLIILPLYYFHFIGVAIILAFLLGTWIATGIMSTQWGLGMSFLDGGANFMKIYARPYFRMGPYLLGMYTGYILYRTNCKYRMNKFVNLLGWFFAALTACLVLYGPYDDLHNGPVSQDVASFYNAVNRTVWGACICWVVFSCANGYGGFINTILSWKALIPLSRLTYCAYLVHPIIMYHFTGNRKRMVHLTDDEIIYQFFGHLGLAYMGAFITSLAFESPMMALEKIVFKTKQRQQ